MSNKQNKKRRSNVKKMTISVLGIPHTVIIKPVSAENKEFIMFGETNISTGEIFINSLHPEDRQIKTLVHEILEVINEHLELGLNHKNLTQLETGLYTSLDSIGRFIQFVKV